MLAQRVDAIEAPVAMPPSHRKALLNPGIVLALLDDVRRSQFGVTSQQAGIVVTSVAPGSDAAQHGVAPADVLLRVQETTVSTMADAQAASPRRRSGTCTSS